MFDVLHSFTTSALEAILTYLEAIHLLLRPHCTQPDYPFAFEAALTFYTVLRPALEAILTSARLPLRF
jgi:hypothetical protein